jgi:hypothetical protein
VRNTHLYIAETHLKDILLVRRKILRNVCPWMLYKFHLYKVSTRCVKNVGRSFNNYNWNLITLSSSKRMTRQTKLINIYSTKSAVQSLIKTLESVGESPVRLKRMRQIMLQQK